MGWNLRATCVRVPCWHRCSSLNRLRASVTTSPHFPLWERAVILKISKGNWTSNVWFPSCLSNLVHTNHSQLYALPGGSYQDIARSVLCPCVSWRTCNARGWEARHLRPKWIKTRGILIGIGTKHLSWAVFGLAVPKMTAQTAWKLVFYFVFVLKDKLMIR